MTKNVEQQQVKEIARRLFREKGYGGVCFNDIATDAHVENSFIRDYFKSKETLFDTIIREQMDILFNEIGLILNKDETSISQKVQLLIQYYFSFMEENKNLNLFILREIKMELGKPTEKEFGKLLDESIFAKQVQQHLSEFNPEHEASVMDLFIDLTSLCVFPLLISPSIEMNGKQEYSISFERHIEKREELIFSWFKTILML